jgi:hypothetical protein
MLRIVNLLIALSFGVHLLQLLQRIGFSISASCLFQQHDKYADLDVASALLVAAVGRSLLDHICGSLSSNSGATSGVGARFDVTKLWRSNWFVAEAKTCSR